LYQNRKLFLVSPSISMQYLVNFGQATILDFKVWKIDNLENSKWSRGPLVSQRQRHHLTDRASHQHVRATPCPMTRRSPYTAGCHCTPCTASNQPLSSQRRGKASLAFSSSRSSHRHPATASAPPPCSHPAASRHPASRVAPLLVAGAIAYPVHYLAS
jgi:hypothetical protein